MKVPVKRKSLRLPADIKRVIARFFFKNNDQATILIREVLSMEEADAGATLQQVLRDFAWRHRNITEIFERHFQRVKFLLKEMQVEPDELPEFRRLLIGSYFTHEYSIESAAFFNPSLILAPDQTGLAEGEVRLIASMRATGEGHISSIVFRYLTIDQNNQLL